HRIHFLLLGLCILIYHVPLPLILRIRNSLGKFGLEKCKNRVNVLLHGECLSQVKVGEEVGISDVSPTPSEVFCLCDDSVRPKGYIVLCYRTGSCLLSSQVLSSSQWLLFLLSHA
ncbi:hypothetical protein RRG08_041820, partial [Elysia crispata]